MIRKIRVWGIALFSSALRRRGISGSAPRGKKEKGNESRKFKSVKLFQLKH